MSGPSRRKSQLHQHLESFYAKMYGALLEDEVQGRRMAVALVAKAAEGSRQAGKYDEEPNPDHLFEAARDDEVVREYLRAIREDGVRDEDIRWWWGLHDLERRVMLLDDINANVAVLSHYLRNGMSPEDASAEVRRFRVIYGNPLDSAAQGDDRPLPLELKGRISRWMVESGLEDPQAIKERVAGYSSLNALVRAEMRAGRL